MPSLQQQRPCAPTDRFTARGRIHGGRHAALARPRQPIPPGAAQRAAAAARAAAPAAPAARCMTGPLNALPDPEHGGSHHESDEAPLLIRELRPLKQTQQDGASASSNGGSGGAQPLGDLADGGGAGSSNGAHSGAASSRFRVMGLDVTPELVAIAMVYFVQGILGLSRLAVSFYFKDDLHVDPAEVAVLTGIAGMPWVIKPLYGFISDAIPLWGYRRRSYLAVCGLLGAASWTALATVTSTPAGAVAAMTLGALSTAASDVVVDSIVVERSRGAPEGTTGSLQSLCWASSAVGGIASAYFSGSLVQAWGTRPVFAATGLFPLFVSFAAFLIDEQRVTAASPGAGDTGGVHATAAASSSSSRGAAASAAAAGGAQAEGDGIFLPVAAASSSSSSSSVIGGAQALVKRMRSQVVALWGAVRQPGIFLPTVFVFLWQATPTNDSAMFYFYTNHLHFTPEFLGRVRLAGSVASLAGVALYNSVFKKVPLKRMFFWAMVLGTALGSTQLLLVSGANRALGLSDELFVLGDSVILTVIGQVSFMPVLVLAARLCPEGVEATLFATLMSILNGGAFVGSAIGAGLTAAFGVTSTDFTHLFALTAVCTFSTLAPMPFLGLLPAAVDRDSPGGDGDEKRDGFGGGAGDEEEEGIALLERGGGGGGNGNGGSGREPHLRRPHSGDVER